MVLAQGFRHDKGVGHAREPKVAAELRREDVRRRHEVERVVTRFAYNVLRQLT